MGVASSELATSLSLDDSSGENPPQRKVGYISYPFRRESFDELVVSPLGYVIEILDADNLRHGLRLVELPGGDSAQADMPNQSLLLQFGERRERLFKGLIGWSGQAPEAKIDHVERIKLEIAQVVVHSVNDFLARASVRPGAIAAAARAHLGHDHQIVWVRMERHLDELIGNVRAVKVAGIDVVHPGCDGLAQNRDRTGNVARWPPDQLLTIPSSPAAWRHIPLLGYGDCRTGKRKCAAKIRSIGHCFSSVVVNECVENLCLQLLG